MRHALGLAAAQRIPYVPVHHMEAHALMARMPGINPQPLQVCETVAFIHRLNA